MRRLFLSALAALVMVSCTIGAEPNTTSLPPSSSTSSSRLSTSTSSIPSTTTSTTIPVTEEESAVYLFFQGYPVAPGPYLVAVARADVDDLSGALTALLEGAATEEVALGLSSTIPEGTRLLGVETSDGVATVDLSRDFETGGGSLSMMGRVAQIVYTATRFEGVNAVRFHLEGAPLDVLGGEGLIIDEPQTRDHWVDLTPPILIEDPMWGSVAGTRLTVSGVAELESGEVSFVIVDAEGLIIHEGGAGTAPGERSEFAFDVIIDPIPNPGLGSIIAWEWAPDGSQQHILEYPLTLGN